MNKAFIVCALYGVLFYAHAAKPKKTIVCTTTILYDITKNLTGNSCTVISLLPTGSDPHTYDPLPQDAQILAGADIVIKNGLMLEGWINELIASVNNQSWIIEASHSITPIQNTALHASPDPHIWMDPILVKSMVDNIAAGILQKFPELSSVIMENKKNYKYRLDTLHQFVHRTLLQIPTEQKILITSHDAFKYYGKRYGLQVEAALGTSTDSDVQMSDIQRLTAIIKKTGVRAVFIESTINPKLMLQLAQDNGIGLGGKLYADALGDSATLAGTYIGMITHNTLTIANGITGPNNSSILSYTDESTVNTLLLLIVAIGIFTGVFLWVFWVVRSVPETFLSWDNYLIEVTNLSVTYERKKVLTNINFTLQSGRIYGLLGPNGAGKSTLFKSILGLITPDTGIVLINGKNINEIKNKIAYIPQKEEIDWTFPATVFDVVLTGRLPHARNFKKFSTADRIRASQAITQMGLNDFINRQIGDLSGGQQQRVFIARALCQEAEVLFFDEPFVGVDVTTEEKIIQIIRTLAKKGKTILMIHHDLSKVKEYFDAVVMINQRLIATGPVHEVLTTENISKTYSGRLSILQESDAFGHQ